MSEVLKKGKGELPLYSQLERILRDRILSGEFSGGDVFPCERELMASYTVSRITVRQALANLTRAGLIEAHPGIGTVVRPEKINEKLTGVKSFSEEMREHGIEMTTGLCTCFMGVPPLEVSSVLGLGNGEKCFILERVRCASSSPVVHSITYIPSAWGLECDPSLYEHSLYEYLRDVKKIVITGARDTFEAVAADAGTAALLHIKQGSPVLKRTRTSFVNDRKTFEYTICLYAADRYKYTVEL
ncbi:MAG: GntR family transcriptional regulator [Bullifex sp.]